MKMLYPNLCYKEVCYKGTESHYILTVLKIKATTTDRAVPEGTSFSKSHIALIFITECITSPPEIIKNQPLLNSLHPV